MPVFLTVECQAESIQTTQLDVEDLLKDRELVEYSALEAVGSGRTTRGKVWVY